MVDLADTRRRPASTRARRARAGDEARSLVARIDWLLLAAAGAIVAYGLWALGGITRGDVPGDPNYHVARQATFAALGAVGMLVAILVHPDWLRRLQPYLYGLTLALTAVTLLPIGFAARGSQRWIDVGPIQLQPSELAKVTFVLALAGYLADRLRRVGQTRTIGTVVALAAAPVMLVFIQPDFGTALVYVAALGGMLVVAGTRWLHLGVLGAGATVAVVMMLWALPAVGVQVLKDYQADRLTGFMNPDSDPAGDTWNVNQSITAVGAGRLDGRGVEGATQTNLDFLPEHATDFVFASLAEQRGFFGASLLLLLYIALIWRGLRVVSVARDSFSAIVAGGIVLALLFQIFVNVGMTMGLAPVTGIPLPFVSVGGSSMIASLLMIGVLQSIHLHGRSAARRSR
jgi:rod shape determining protein RodA